MHLSYNPDGDAVIKEGYYEGKEEDMIINPPRGV